MNSFLPFSASGATVQTQAQGSDQTVAPATTAAWTDAEMAQLQKAAVKFESFFVAQMLKQMRQATAALADDDSPLKAQVNQAPLAMADMAVADELASRSAFGIADVLVRQMSGAGLQSAQGARGITSRNLS